LAAAEREVIVMTEDAALAWAEDTETLALAAKAVTEAVRVTKEARSG
jgi:hypothetical protein